MDLAIFFFYGGRWDEHNNYIDHHIKGIIVQEGIGYIELIQKIYNELKLSPTEKSIMMAFDPKFENPNKMTVENDTSVAFYLHLIKNNPNFRRYLLGVEIEQQPDLQIVTVNNEKRIPIVKEVCESNTDVQDKEVNSLTNNEESIQIEKEVHESNSHLEDKKANSLVTFESGTYDGDVSCLLLTVTNMEPSGETTIEVQTDQEIAYMKVKYVLKNKQFVKTSLSKIAIRNNFQIKVDRSDKKMY